MRKLSGKKIRVIRETETELWEKINIPLLWIKVVKENKFIDNFFMFYLFELILTWIWVCSNWSASYILIDSILNYYYQT